MALDDDAAWPARHALERLDRAGVEAERGQRLAWPTAIAITLSLSATLWIGIGWLARLAFG